MRRLIAGLAALGLMLVACSGDPTASEEYQELEAQLAEVTAERDELAEEKVG